MHIPFNTTLGERSLYQLRKIEFLTLHSRHRSSLSCVPDSCSLIPCSLIPDP
jgi:hypothetical protein